MAYVSLSSRDLEKAALSACTNSECAAPMRLNKVHVGLSGITTRICCTPRRGIRKLSLGIRFFQSHWERS